MGLTAAVLLAGCARRRTRAEAGIATQTLLVGNSAEPADLDPDATYGWPDSNIEYALFEPLTWIDEKTTKPIPAAAKSWDVSPDGLVITFHLRPEGRWSNGDPVTADDFAFAYRRILTPSYAAVYSYMLWPIKNAEAYNEGKITDFSKVGVKAVDPLTLQIILAKPTPYVPAMAFHNTWMPVHRATVEKFGPFDRKGTAWTRPGNLVGNGPFILKEWIPNGRIVVEKNPRYWNAAHVRLNRIEFYPYEDGDAEEMAFRSGELDVTYGLPISRLPYYRRVHPEELRIDTRLAHFYLFLNVNRPPLDNLKLRQALALAVHRDAICRDILAGAEGIPAHCFTPPDCGGYTARAGIPDDFAQARRLLAEAGYPGGRGLPVMNIISQEKESAVRTVEAIQASWARELGVHVTIAPLEFKTLLQESQTHDYTIAYSGWIADYPEPSTFLDMMITGGGNNYAGWSNKQYDRILAQAEGTMDEGRRYELYQKAEAILLDEAPLIPLYFENQAFLVKPWVHDWPPSKLGFVHFTNVWLGN